MGESYTTFIGIRESHMQWFEKYRIYSTSVPPKLTFDALYLGLFCRNFNSFRGEGVQKPGKYGKQNVLYDLTNIWSAVKPMAEQLS